MTFADEPTKQIQIIATSSPELLVFDDNGDPTPECVASFAERCAFPFADVQRRLQSLLDGRDADVAHTDLDQEQVQLES